MITSNFTLEYSIGVSSKFAWAKADVAAKANVPRLPMPSQLQRLQVREEVWTSIYDDATGVAQQEWAAAQAAESKEVKPAKGFSASFGRSKRVEQKKTDIDIDAEKAMRDETAKKEWATLLSRCNSTLKGCGVAAHLMLDPKTKIGYGIDFRCDATMLGPNKLELWYDQKRGMWTWPRDQVPGELAALQVDAESWTAVWDKTQSALKHAKSLEVKIKEKVKLSLISGNTRDIHNAIALSAKSVEDKRIARNEQEFEWGKLLDFADDIFFKWGINAKLMRHEDALDLLHCGLVLRFHSAVPFVPVATATATLATGKI